ncbi:uncharacterized protein LOC131205693 [Anopheles bellator]|uniref:uncharacterized protein LOC131205693 n=1 Tax=Anopheles bellator TaxID=139047 RepID=UPI0026491B4F|nr:uncharacterized protein LOC131205693 [Anopheles bellator]
MGRKGNFVEKPKKGPGRKARKQGDPVFKFMKDDGEDNKKLSRNQKIRLKKREMQKQLVQKVTKQKRDTKAANQADPVVPSTVDPSELFDLEKTRQKYKQLGEKNKSPTVTATKTVENGASKKVRNLFDSDDEMENKEPKKRAGSGRPSKSQMKKFLQQTESDEDDSDEQDSDSGEEIDDDGDDSDQEDDNEEEGSEEDEDDESDDEEGDTDDEDGDDSDMLPIEAANKKLKRRMELEQKMADQEMQEAAANRERFEFPTEEEVAQTSSLQDVNMRIKDVIGVLSDFTANRDPDRSRCEYIDLLRKDLCLYYSYNEYLMNLLMELFAPNELLEFLEASELQRPITIRTNSLKARRRDLAQALINRGINLDPIGKWSKDGLVVYTSQVPLGATPEYLAGQYMLQGGSSMLPVLALAPEENERILDMCAAPGGKSSHIAAMMKNTGVLIVNDSNKDRLHAVLGNFHRLGVQNAIVTCMDGIKFCDAMKGFDRVLLDAPCTGSGVIAKDPSVKTSKTEIDVQRCYNLQRRLLLSAIDCLSAKSNSGGYLVYSTCSVLPQENEWVIDFALKMRNVRLVSTGIDFGVEGLTRFGAQRYHPSMKLTRRFYPHTHNMDGFFVAKLHKFSDAIPTGDTAEAEATNGADMETAAATESEEMKLPKKIDKRDWYYQDVVAKRKAQREDKNHVVKVFQKPTNVTKKKKKKFQKSTDSVTTVQRVAVPTDDQTASSGQIGSNSGQKLSKKFSVNGKPAASSADRETAEVLKLKQMMKKLKQKQGTSTANGKGTAGKAGKSTKQTASSKEKVPGTKKNAITKKLGKVYG